MPNDPQYVPDVSPVSGIPAQQTYFLGRYRIIDEIGLGGMASVHLARVDGLGGFQRWFAIKRIHAHLVEDETFVNMFLDEANVAARISHPNVATVFELGKHDDTYWIAMEYLHGEPLREVMRRTEEMGATMPPEIACRVIAEAADGLHAAHELTGKDGEKLNLIHRDVTPHNLFVTYEGVTKVVDFGIAKFQDRMASTQAGTLKGKLAYMSPEQVQGETIDRRTDIFALGVVLWELTTGQRLFRMDSDLDTLAKVQECNIPAPSTMVRGYPLDLEKILMQALAKNRDERFSTAREFSRALLSLLNRRGLFIANDEVAAYMASIFVDRIAKREEHLRWASAVSDAAAAAAAAAAPPAPPPAPRNTVQPRPGPPATQATPAVVRPLPAPPISVAPRGAPRPAAGAPAYGRTGPASMTASQQNLPQPPTVAYGRPAAALARPVQPLQAVGSISYPLPPAPKTAPPPQAVPVLDDDDDEDKTVQATALQQAAAHAGYEDDYDDEADATIVSRSAPSDTMPPSDNPPAILPAAGAPARPPPPPISGRPPPVPSSGRPPVSQPPPVPRQNLRGTMPLSAVAQSAALRPPQPQPIAPPQTQQRTSPPNGGLYPPAPPTGFGERGMPPNGFPQQGGFPDRSLPPGFHITDPSLPNPGPATLPPPPRAPQAWGAPLPPPPSYGAPPPLGSPFAQAPLPTFPQNGYPPQPQFGQPYIANATQLPYPDPRGTQNILRPRRVPQWAVALVSCIIALVLAGGALLVYSLVHTSHPTGPRVASSGGSPAGPAASGGGLFGAARAGFLAAATPQPFSANTPDSPPTPSAAPSDSAVVAAVPPTPPDPAPPQPVAVADPTPPPPPPQPQAPPPQPATPPPAATPQPLAVASRPDPAPTPTPTRYQAPASTPVAALTTSGSARGYLSVICLPGCDRVEVDGQPFGASPIFKKPMAVGSHKIKLVSSNPPGTKIVSKIVIADSVAMVRESMP